MTARVIYLLVALAVVFAALAPVASASWSDGGGW